MDLKLLKKIITEGISSDALAMKKLNALKSGERAVMLECYNELLDRYGNALHESVRGYAKDMLRNKSMTGPEELRKTLVSWLKSDAWQHSLKKLKQPPDEHDFDEAFSGAVEELLGRRNSFDEKERDF